MLCLFFCPGHEEECSVVSKLNELIKINMSFPVVILQRDTKGWYSRKCSIVKRTLLLVSSAEEQDAIEMSERKKIIYNIYR
jgi:hypothetical protein